MFSPLLPRHYRKLLICRRPKAVGVGKIAVGIGLRRRLPSVYQPIGIAKKAVDVSKVVGVGYADGFAVDIVPSAYFFIIFNFFRKLLLIFLILF